MAQQKTLEEGAICERAQYFLKVLIERYIAEGQPVGSCTLARDAGLDLSPATIRNVMADLEELGLVIAPHTSAGRIPTVSGYRMFVDSLLTVQPLATQDLGRLKEQLEHEPDNLLESASHMLSGLTRMAGVVMLPRQERMAFRQIEFLPLSGTRVLTILVANDEEVHNCIINTKREYSRAELEQAANFLNQTFSGQTLDSMRKQLFQDMQKARVDMDRIMARAVEMAGQVFQDDGLAGDCFISGQTNLMNFNDLSNMSVLRHLFDAFTEKHEILHLLDQCMQADGVQIFIGEESGYQNLDNCSLVTAPYEVDDEVAGVLGVIGPTRMAYDRVIPIVDITAKLLGAALKQR
ncbi:Heat-inducible transcription repressor HrcA [hydrothermal vent metagenome]|uniref:Heat-inducible transcription repressor HrcA n=1 Tax=hydrothermal vent metagenome TaxID=652676 RepID=A0A3B1B6L5_9ZZZZ